MVNGYVLGALRKVSMKSRPFKVKWTDDDGVTRDHELVIEDYDLEVDEAVTSLVNEYTRKMLGLKS